MNDLARTSLAVLIVHLCHQVGGWPLGDQIGSLDGQPGTVRMQARQIEQIIPGVFWGFPTEEVALPNAMCISENILKQAWRVRCNPHKRPTPEQWVTFCESVANYRLDTQWKAPKASPPYHCHQVAFIEEKIFSSSGMGRTVTSLVSGSRIRPSKSCDMKRFERT